MSHPREDIRKAIASVIIAANTAAGSKVYASRVIQIKDDTLPCILVYTNTEEVSISQESPREYGRALKVVVDVHAKADKSLDDVLDDLSLEVENVLMQDHKLGDLVCDVVLTGVEVTLSGEGDAPIGSCAMTYEVTYNTYAVADATEENNVTDFEKTGVEWDQPDHAEGDIDAQDEFTIPT